MLGLVLIPIAVLVTAVCGLAVCVGAGWDAHVGELLAAGGIALLAGELAMAPVLLVRGSSQPATAQAGLAGTVVQLIVSIAAATALMVLRVGLDQQLLYWLLPMYWTTLGVLVFVFIREVKAAPAPAAPRHET